MSDDGPDFEAILDRCGSGLLLYARSLGSPEPEELVQEAFANLWEQIQAGTQIANPGAYLATTIRNAAGRAARRRRAESGAAAVKPWFQSEAPGPWEPEKLETILRGLPDDQREVLVLKIWLGLTFEQIALSLGIPMNTAASRYRYAMERLRHMERIKQ